MANIESLLKSSLSVASALPSPGVVLNAAGCDNTQTGPTNLPSTSMSRQFDPLSVLGEEPVPQPTAESQVKSTTPNHGNATRGQNDLGELLFPIDEKESATDSPSSIRVSKSTSSLQKIITFKRPSSAGGQPNGSNAWSFTPRRGSSWAEGLSQGGQLPAPGQISSTPKTRKRPSSSGGQPSSPSGAFPSALSFMKPWSSAASPMLTKDLQQHEQSPASSLPNLTKVESHSPRPESRSENRPTTSSSFSKMSLSSVFGALSLSRSNPQDEHRGRSEEKDKRKSRSSSAVSAKDDRSQSRNRSQSPFSLRRFRSREASPGPPMPLHLEEPDHESPHRSTSVRPRTAFADDPDSGSDAYESDESEGWSDDGDIYDTVTVKNTEQNALMVPTDAVLNGDNEDIDLGEGVNVVVPPEPYFPSTLNGDSTTLMGRTKPGSQKRKKSRMHEALPHSISRPVFQRDRCTITITQGEREVAEKKKRTYVVASDMSQESRYAVEWGIGTVLRDGDEMRIVTILESESKVDPAVAAATPAERQVKVRSQQERQGLAYILVRQATSLLQRTKLCVTVRCEAWHAKNARHMLLDIVDHVEPTMLIVGSRGMGQLKGILLGSTSHYLIEKCSVPVMVARRRLKRPARRSAHLNTNRRHVSLAEAGIDTVVSKVDQDVETMRDEIKRDDEERGHAGPEERDSGDEGDEEIETVDRKVPG